MISISYRLDSRRCFLPLSILMRFTISLENCWHWKWQIKEICIFGIKSYTFQFIWQLSVVISEIIMVNAISNHALNFFWERNETRKCSEDHTALLLISLWFLQLYNLDKWYGLKVFLNRVLYYLSSSNYLYTFCVRLILICLHL